MTVRVPAGLRRVEEVGQHTVCVYVSQVVDDNSFIVRADQLWMIRSCAAPSRVASCCCSWCLHPRFALLLGFTERFSALTCSANWCITSLSARLSVCLSACATVFPSLSTVAWVTCFARAAAVNRLVPQWSSGLLQCMEPIMSHALGG